MDWETFVHFCTRHTPELSVVCKATCVLVASDSLLFVGLKGGGEYLNWHFRYIDMFFTSFWIFLLLHLERITLCMRGCVAFIFG